MKYVVVHVVDRELQKYEIANTLPEATQLMREGFMEVFLDYYEKEDFENPADDDQEWRFHEREAWITTCHGVGFDWYILEVE